MSQRSIATWVNFFIFPVATAKSYVWALVRENSYMCAELNDSREWQ